MTTLAAEQKTLLTPIINAASLLIEASLIAEKQGRAEVCFAIDPIVNSLCDLLKGEGVEAP
jgi:hypothetical protein